MAQVRPIRPSEVGEQQKASIPAAVLEAFNELIAANYVNGSATVRQGDVVRLALRKMDGDGPFDPGEETRFNSKWLNVEEVFRDAGWTVTYDKPGFNESYEPTFRFTKGRAR